MNTQKALEKFDVYTIEFLTDDNNRISNEEFMRVSSDMIEEIAKVTNTMNEKIIGVLPSSDAYKNNILKAKVDVSEFSKYFRSTIVDLIKEPDNPHDKNAIRVEVNGETVGYVANSKYTLIKEVKSATDIKNNLSTQAEVQFILFNEWVIAKLI